MKPSHFLAVALAVTLVLLGLPYLVAKQPEPKPYSHTAPWSASMYDPPPEGRPIVGFWDDPARAHVVVVIRGEAFEAAGPEARVLKLEHSAPVIWWELP